MGAIEALILALYAMASTWYNIEQSSQIGALEADNDRLQAITRQCSTNESKQHRRALDAVNIQAARERQSESAGNSYREELVEIVADRGEPCPDADIGSYVNRSMDARKRYLERLRNIRLQARPEPLPID